MSDREVLCLLLMTYLHAAVIGFLALSALHEETIQIAIQDTTVVALIVSESPFREDPVGVVEFRL